MSDPDAPARTTLQRIADALGVPVESFHRGDGAGERGDTLELLQLWQRIASPRARRRLIDCARQEAKRDQ